MVLMIRGQNKNESHYVLFILFRSGWNVLQAPLQQYADHKMPYATGQYRVHK